MSLGLRRATRVAAAGIGVAVTASLLAGCSAGGRETVHFTFSKREAISFMTEVVDEFNASQDEYEVVMDTSGPDVIAASFVRGNPPDLMLANYNQEVARFVQRCALTDLSETEAAADIRPEMQPLLDQYGVCEGRTTALPYSVMAASVIYNKEIFAEHDLEVPQTWSELIEVCDTLQAAGVAPFYATFADAWTANQGWFDYAIGGSLDVLDFYDQLAAQGTDVGPDSPVSFQKDFLEPIEKMQLLASAYTQQNASSRGYDAGNVAFANGEGAMYLQGPWAFSEIAKTNPDLELGTFPLPMTEDPADLKVRVNMDLVTMIPEEAENKEGALAFLEHLFQPELIQEYNESQLGFVPTTTGDDPSDPRVEGMIGYYNEGAVYQGPGVLNPRAIPTENYAQSLVLGADASSVLQTMDADWARLAFRQPAVSTEETAE
ncbi:carbohydrate-binding protein [Microbacterium barkeri]|uniref:Carbohydrate-binding protein n=1 Tax=Microbacterium barkeri TaxID=33917 RepID=A0A9W6LWT1_9MICO|nr:extracellular solute-binding protein [Microbacterium barkeri]MDR6877881.1 raffinose/stachyose/melibiose transport system substrate-binding protein [Microbacterium barkeri]GLJ61706.1 carbohydrate-binding protein [Microbacterium barkeri]